MINFSNCVNCVRVIRRHFEWAFSDELISSYVPEDSKLTRIVQIQRNTFKNLYKRTQFYLRTPLIYTSESLEDETSFDDMVLVFNANDNLANVQDIIVREAVKMIIAKSELPDSFASRMFFKSMFEESSLMDMEFDADLNLDGSLEEMINSFTKAICYTINDNYDFYSSELGLN